MNISDKDKVIIYEKYLRDTSGGLNKSNILWLDTGGKGVCPTCDYGSDSGHPDYDPLKEHSKTCGLVQVINTLGD